LLLDSNEAVPRLPGFRAIGGAYTDHLRALGRALEVARILQAPIVRIFGFWREGPTTDEVEQLAAERLGPAIELACEAGVVLALETCPHSYFDWGIRTARLVQRIDSPWLRLLWDPAGAYRAGELDYLAPYPALRPYLAHVHVKDMVVDPSLPRGLAYVPVGHGEIDWKKIMTWLVHDGYDGVLSLETHHLGPDGRRESAATASFAGLARLYRAITARALAEQARPEEKVNND
jgi:L-ribulose-5-phosphate 3-epimerase